jgi:hypothetical protein
VHFGVILAEAQRKTLGDQMSRSKIQLDIQTIHADDIGEAVGEFYGTPIRVWYASTSAIHEDRDMTWRIAVNRANEEARNG